MTSIEQATAWDSLRRVISEHQLVPGGAMAGCPRDNGAMAAWLGRCARVINEEKWLDAVEMATGMSSYSRLCAHESVLGQEDEILLRGRYGSVVVSSDAGILVLGMLNPYLRKSLQEFMAALGRDNCLFVAISPQFFLWAEEAGRSPVKTA
jgi:hypothetical protein